MLNLKIDNQKYNIIDLLYIMLSFCSIITCYAFGEDLFSNIFLLPSVFLTCFFIFLTNLRKKSLTIQIATFCLFLRYVLLPFSQSLLPIYGFSSFYTNNVEMVDKAIFLMSYELIAISLFFAYYIQNNFNVNKLIDENRFKIRYNNYHLIFAFSIIAMLLPFLDPSVMEKINFFMIKSDSALRVGSIESSSLGMMKRQIFIVGFLSMFIILATYLKRNYYFKWPKFVLYTSIIGAFLCISMIVSEQRSSQIYTGFASFILLSQLFPNEKYKIKKYILAAVTVILAILSIYKHFAAFNYSSYGEAVMQSSVGSGYFVQMLEIYLLGPISVASGMSFESIYYDLSIQNLFFDIFRSIIGLSFIVKDFDMQVTSELYNLYVTAGRSSYGYLLPISTQGYLELGFLLSPVLIIFFLYVAFKLERLMYNSKSTYVVFFCAYMFIRFSSCMVASNLNTVLTSSSIVIISSGAVYACQWIFNKIVLERK